MLESIDFVGFLAFQKGFKRYVQRAILNKILKGDYPELLKSAAKKLLKYKK